MTETVTTVKPFFATPAYDGSCHALMVRAVMGERDLLREVGLESVWEPFCGCCYLPVARNQLIDQFLKTDCTDFIFWDADVVCEPGASVKLILPYDREIVAGIYPHKTDRNTFPVIYETDPDGRPVVDFEKGLIQARGVPTGFMRIKRSVFDKMIEYYGDDLLVENRHDPKNIQTYNCFFDTLKIDRTWWGEDLHFCNKWREAGGEIWIEPDINFWHHGMKAFQGNFHDYLRSLPGGGGPPEKEWRFEPRV